MGSFLRLPNGKIVKEIETAPRDWWWEWPKLEPDVLSKLVLVLPEVLQRVEAIETHLAEGAKTPFVRPSQRFSTEVHDPTEVLNSLSTRLEALEKAIAPKK